MIEMVDLTTEMMIKRAIKEKNEDLAETCRMMLLAQLDDIKYWSRRLDDGMREQETDDSRARE